MISRAGPDSRPASPAASLGVPVGVPSFAGGAARTAHAPSAELGAGGDSARAATTTRPFASDGPGDPGGAAPQGDPGGDVEGGGTLSDSIDEGVGGTSTPNEAPPADAGAEGADR